MSLSVFVNSGLHGPTGKGNPCRGNKCFFGTERRIEVNKMDLGNTVKKH